MSRRRKPKQWEPVIVTWLDASFRQESDHSEKVVERYKPCIRRFIGWYMGENADVMLLATDDDRKANTGEDDCQGINAIPHGMVKHVAILAEAEE